jgi:hypothetical protein
MEQTYKITLFIDKRDLGILQPNGSYGTKNHSDWHITIPFIKTSRIVEDYIHVYLDPFRTIMTRQLVNPYFIEYGFFENIQSYSASTDGNILHNIKTKAPVYGIDINK